MKKQELVSLIKECYREVLSERIVTPEEVEKLNQQLQDAEGDTKKQEKITEKIWKTMDMIYNQYDGIIRNLTNASGYWYVGSSQKELAKKLKDMSMDDYKKFRSEVAAFYNELRNANNAMENVKKTANKLIAKLDK